jgi:hypothetical protein
MVKLKRDIVKYIRDKAKNKYQKGSACEICDATEQLDFHHFFSLAPLVHKWIRDNKLNPDYILALREDFIEEHKAELYNDTATLCHKHHVQLHRIYGRDPGLGTAKKQMRWVEIQREKHNGMV